MSSTWLGLANALAAGMMLGASVTLLLEAVEHTEAWLNLAIGILSGVGLIMGSKRLLNGYDEETMSTALGSFFKGADAKRVILVFGAMLLHSFAEGVSIGVSFAGSAHLAKLVTLSLATHNIPEGLAITLVLMRKGATPLASCFWSIVSSLPQPLMAVPAFIGVAFFTELLPFGLGFAASAMAFVAIVELIPEARSESQSDCKVFSVLLLSCAAMVSLNYLDIV